jgi:hypothetical protein
MFKRVHNIQILTFHNIELVISLERKNLPSTVTKSQSFYILATIAIPLFYPSSENTSLTYHHIPKKLGYAYSKQT